MDRCVIFIAAYVSLRVFACEHILSILVSLSPPTKGVVWKSNEVTHTKPLVRIELSKYKDVFEKCTMDVTVEAHSGQISSKPFCWRCQVDILLCTTLSFGAQDKLPPNQKSLRKSENEV